MKKALVLGCGLIGRTIALDLSQDFEVTVMDYSRKSLDMLEDITNIRKCQGSARDMKFITELAEDADIVCGVLPSDIEGEAQRQVISMGKNYVSPAGFVHAEGMDELAKQKGVTAVFDMGVAPGMSNYLVARGAHMLDKLEKGVIYVGGIPKKLDPPFNYRTVFCLEDTLNEYVAPARYVINNELTEAPALSGLEEIEFEGIGKLEAFFTDGLRSAAYNVKGALVAEKTLRWPGYVDAINIVKATGLLGQETVEINGVSVRPIDFAALLLRPRWELRPEKGDRDYTLMRVIATGPQGKDIVTYTWEMIDELDERRMLHSMARTTGFPCAITARAIANGMIKDKGFIAPEHLVGNDKFYYYLIGEQKKRGVVYQETVARKIM